MRIRGVLFGMAVASCFWVTARADEPIALKILYAGNPGSSREKDFVAFLKPSFQQVVTTVGSGDTIINSRQ